MGKQVHDMTPNTGDVALILEGGGLRASYTAGAVVTLLVNNINFPKVYGISAGTSHAVNYISRDPRRTKVSFVDFVTYPHFGGIGTFLRGKGYFNASYLYEGIAQEVAGTDDPLAFDWDTFVKNPADVHVEAFDVDTGETVVWTKADMPTLYDMMIRVRASSSMPIAMPNTMVDGRRFADGGLGTSWGIPLEAAQRYGFTKFFIVRTQPKEYRKQPIPEGEQHLLRSALRKHPLVAQRTIERWSYYNEICDQIEALEAEGRAYVFYARDMAVSSHETDLAKLEESYRMGYAQAQSEVGAWKAFLRGAGASL